MPKILITCGLEAFSQRVSVQLEKLGWDVIFTSSENIPDILIKKGRYSKISPATNSIFVHELLKIALDKQADAILPLSRDEVQRLSKESVLFEEYDIKICIPESSNLDSIPVLINPQRNIDLIFNNFGFYTSIPNQEAYLCLSI